MKRIFTLLRLFAACCLLLLTTTETKAQAIDEAVCLYEDNCIFIAYSAVQEESPTSTNLVVILTAFINQGGRCSTIDGLVLSPVGGVPVLVTREELQENAFFIELPVNRALFTATPDVLVSTFRYIGIPFFGIRFPLPTNVVDLQARLDSNDPCLAITPLPVELASFDGKVTQSGIQLEWVTASEENNSKFEVEHSADGTTFEQIGKVDGHGNSSITIEYDYLDSYPLPGLNYYRLRQVDFDGRYEFSNVISVNAPERAQSLQVTLSPNPCRGDDCQLSIASVAPWQQVRVQLQDLTGRVVFEQILKDSMEKLQLTQQQLQNLRGIFILSAEAGAEVVRQRVVLE
ncbi:hypothetical protein POKO110462_16705 [Pontibacter korlensis]|uniref:hypothetical protein n=1 Tax=Pontibacter korlensis TaxID=400092 RepID=UPI0006978C42|nr:hypothetical protein [Pontibacter korlensis]